MFMLSVWKKKICRRLMANFGVTTRFATSNGRGPKTAIVKVTQVLHVIPTKKLFFRLVAQTQEPDCVVHGIALSRVGTAISLHLHFRVLPGINRFQINVTGFETGFQSKVLKTARSRFQILENWF